MKRFEKFGVEIPHILLPKQIDLNSWSVIACDQYTQDRAYWEKASEIAGDKPSTLHLIFPEVYLQDSDKDARIESIKKTMSSYLSDGVFADAADEFIYIERKTAYGRVRKGLLLAVDLETYEWKPFSKAFIRATEATVPERIPPRKKIRYGAPLESPHIMLLADDESDALVGGTGNLVKGDKPVYDGDLQQKSGHITGWAVKDEKVLAHVEEALDNLKKHGTDAEGNVFLFAVGDGNHSLATAKAVWDEYKEKCKAEGKADALEGSPVRYALVEVVNIYDEGLTFEPIHRAIFNQDNAKLVSFLTEKLGGQRTDCATEKELLEAVGDRSQKGARFGFVHSEGGKVSYQLLQTQITDLAISRLQPALDEFVSVKEDIDYIHGSDEVCTLGKKDKTLGILLPPIAKDSFFATISGRGPLPRKSFSMGEASEKRFYVECRKLF